MLEIVFTDGKIGSKAVKIIAMSENGKLNLSALPEKEASLIKKLITRADFKGCENEVLNVFGEEGKFIVLGMGKKITPITLQNIGGNLFKQLFKDDVACFYVEEIKGCKLNQMEIAHNLAFGLMLGSYSFDKYFTKKKQSEYSSLEQVIFKLENPEQANEDFKYFAALGNGVRYARDLCNEPANYLTPEVFADDIKRLEYLDLEVEILSQKELEEKDFNLLLSVAKGSANKPKVAIVKWRGNPTSDEFECGLIGKGVTFDSGGISLKSSAHIHEMKNDMMGAAVVVATMKALALQKSKKNIIAIVGLVENMPCGNATRPSDVIASMSGQTVEVINTDAEGRLVLGDCIWYLQENYNVNKLIDVATLTGAISVALGSEYAGIFSNDDKLSNELIKSGIEVDEPLWRLPINENYNKMINSDIADMSNTGTGGAGSSRAACFIQRFVQENKTWAHLDIAGVDMETKGKPICPKGATAFGIRLLVNYLKD